MLRKPRSQVNFVPDPESFVKKPHSTWQLRIRIRMDPHHFGKAGPDRYQREKSDPDVHFSQKTDPDPHQRYNFKIYSTQKYE
jgi:hypothetical protein